MYGAAVIGVPPGSSLMRCHQLFEIKLGRGRAVLARESGAALRW